MREIFPLLEGDVSLTLGRCFPYFAFYRERKSRKKFNGNGNGIRYYRNVCSGYAAPALKGRAASQNYEEQTS